jgi:hypothetical protein
LDARLRPSRRDRQAQLTDGSELQLGHRVNRSDLEWDLDVIRLVVLAGLMALAVILALVSAADARKRRWIEFHIDGPGAAPYAREAAPQDRGHSPPRPGGLGAAIARLVGDCQGEAAQLKQWPFEVIARIAALSDTQRKELEDLRARSQSAAERLAAECPQVAEGPGARLNLVEQAVDAADSAFATIEPELQRFYAALDDEQKARILRDLTFGQRTAEQPERVRARREGRRRSQPKPASTPPRAEPPWAGLCQEFTAALRNWPTLEIERGVRLSETQRVALYELVTASLKAAESLAGRCPQETPITPVRRMAVLRVSLQAIRDAATSITASYAKFYEGLDQGQQAKFAEMR